MLFYYLSALAFFSSPILFRISVKKDISLFCLLEVKKKSGPLSWIERRMYKRLASCGAYYSDEVYKARDRKSIADDGTVFKTKEGKILEKSFFNKNLVLTKSGEMELTDLKKIWLKECLTQSFGWMPKAILSLILKCLSAVLVVLLLLGFLL